MTWLSLALGVVTLLRQVASWFSADAKLRRLELALERRRSAQAVEAERLKAAYMRIDREKPGTPEETLERLKRHFTKRP